MTEYVQSLQEIDQLPESTHLFCPRTLDDEDDRYEEDEGDVKDIQDTARRKHVQDAKDRRRRFLSTTILLAFDGNDVVPYHEKIYNLLDRNLKRCEVCVRRYHIERMDFLVQLRQDYNEPEIQDFLAILDRRDVSRIQEGLSSAAEKLRGLPENKRGVSAVEHSDLIALFEALHCKKFHESEDLLTRYFDEPFKLIQTKKPLRANEIFPSMTKFLFDSNTGRLSWAVEAWGRSGKSLTDLEWDYAVRDTLQHRINNCSNPNSSNKLWTAIKVIIRKLDVHAISYKLFDLSPPFGRLALDHLAQKTYSVPAIVWSLQMVCEKAPDAFWQTMQSISSLTVVENIFNSPNFDACLEKSLEKDAPPDANVLSWVLPFLRSIKPAGRPVACHPLVFQLFQRVQSKTLSEDARKSCFRVALSAIQSTVCTFTDSDAYGNAALRPAISGALDIISTYLEDVLNPKVQIDPSDIRNEVMVIVRSSIALEVYCLKVDFDTLMDHRPMGHESCSFSPDVWDTATNRLTDANADLSRAVLTGILPFTGLDEVRTTDRALSNIKEEIRTTVKKDIDKYNTVFRRIKDKITEAIEKISEFTPDHLDTLFSEQQTCMTIFAALFSGDDAIYQAGLAIIKGISGQVGRKEAIEHMLRGSLSTCVYAVDWVTRRFANTKAFVHVARFLRIGRDILEVLSDSTGILRTQILDSRGYGAVQSYWSYQWSELKIIFQYTEQWSLEVHDKALMMDLARDTMQYAEDLFDKYHLFLGVLNKSKPEKAEEVPGILLDTDPATSTGSPARAFYGMSQWLRLRDQYLANTLTNLITTMLRRLKEYGTVMPEQNLEYLLAVLIDGYRSKSGKIKNVKTLLTPQQKAELTRAVESYVGRTIIEHPSSKKQSTLNSWAVSGTSSRSSTPASGVIEIDDDDEEDEFGDGDINDEDISKLSARHEAIQNARRDAVKDRSKLVPGQKPKPIPLSSSIRPGPSAQEIRDRQLRDRQQLSSKAFIERRKQEQADAAARRKEAALRLRGTMGVGEQTSGAGSGISGIGVKGKDHNAAQNNIMMSSESEADSDDDDELFGKIRTVSRPGGPGGIPRAVTTGPVRKIKQARSQKDIRARLTPDLSSLHRDILSWDFFADTDTPPSSNKTDYTLVTNKFKSTQDYVRTFEPLLVLEAWQSFRSAREDGNFKQFEIKVASSLIVDNFYEVNTVVPMAEQKELGLGVSDIVLLSRGKQPHSDKSEPHCLARVKEITRKKGDAQIVYRVNAANNPLRSYLNDKSTVYGVQIQSLTPLEREYSALMALEYYDLCEEIIKAKPSPLLNYSETELRDIRQVYNVNTAQAKAVRSAIDNDAFTLIQGPPGSGKTKTICAIVGAMLTTSFKKGGRQTSNGQVAPPPSAKKILVCAPSNAAVDELVMRFKAGIKMMDGSDEKINVVRLGRSDAINTAVKDVTLEELVNSRLNTAAPKDKEDIHSIMMEHKATSEELNKHRSLMDQKRGHGEQLTPEEEKVFDGLKRKKTALGAKIDNLREQQNSASRDAELNRKRMQQEVLDTSHVLCATLSGSGHEIFQGLNVEFETVIIDEAAQSIELSALIPLKYGCSKCILVGDPKQLPPTVLSREAAKFQYQQSLFARMEINHKDDIHLLDTQYRMHPEISMFPSRMFYDSRLKDGDGMAKLRARPWHHSEIFAPYRFFDVQGMSQAATKGHSLVNIAELNVAMQLYDRLITDVPKYDFKGKIGIITPYKGQLNELKIRFRNRYGESILSHIEFNTTDAFQGRESEIIIFSCVRASTSGLGFLNDIRRMNVGLTRAKCSLWVLGNSEALTKGEYWRGLVGDAKSRNLYTDGDINKLLKRPLLTEDMMRDDVTMEDVDSDARTPENQKATLPKPEPNQQKSSNLVKQEQAKPVPVTDGAARRGRPVEQLSRNSSSVSVSRSVSKASSVASSDMDHKGSGVRNGLSVKKEASESNTFGVAQSKKVNGPSGGRFGLNDKAKCNFCGSDAHFTPNCDNEAAREASIGKCNRCGKGGHTYSSCRESRCIACGRVGHLEQLCTVPTNQRLTEHLREQVKRQEIEFGRYCDRTREKRVEKRLGEHAAKIPTVKATVPSNGSQPGDHQKRKRENSTSSDGGPPKGSKTTRTNNAVTPVMTTAATIRSTSSSSDHQNGSAVQPSVSRDSSGSHKPSSKTGGANNGPSIRPPGSTPRPPQIIKRKRPNAEDMFVKRK